MNTIEALKRGFAVTAKNPGLVLILFVFALITNALSSSLKQAPSPAAVLQLLIFVALVLIVNVLIQGGILSTIRDYIKEGRAGLAGFPKYCLKYFWRFLGLGLAIMASVVIVFAVALLIILAMMAVKLAIIGEIAGLITAGIGLYCVILLSAMSPYVIVSEEMPVIKAMTKSIIITRKGINNIALLFLITILISVAWMSVLKLIPGSKQIVTAILTGAFSGYFGIVFSASYMELYLSLAR